MFLVLAISLTVTTLWSGALAAAVTDHVEVRLTHGWRPSAGRVEVSVNGTWGTICVTPSHTNDHIGWSFNTATVVCKQLGFPTVRYSFPLKSFSDDVYGEFIVTELSCYGNETSLQNCSYKRIIGEQSTPQHCFGFYHQEAGIECEDRVRLMGGPNVTGGWVEVFEHGTWHGVCGDKFTAKDAAVLCREMDYKQVVDWYTQKIEPLPKEVEERDSVYSLDCFRSSGTLNDCTYTPTRTSKCGHVVYLNCQSHSEGEVRLLGSPHPGEGHVAVYYNLTWSSICDDGWDLNDAHVVCRQLGFPGAEQKFGLSHFAQNVFNHYWYEDLECTGLENRIQDCPSPGIGVTSCVLGEEAGLRCSKLDHTDSKMRLIGIDGHKQKSAGILQIKRADEWRSVCYNRHDMANAEVACRELGYRHAESTYYGSLLGNSTPYTEAWVENVRCRGYEDAFYQCNNDGYQYLQCNSLGLDVTVINCTNNEPQMSLRLTGGGDNSEGLVMVNIDGTDGMICGDGWSFANAQVVCRQLGYATVLRTFTGEDFGGNPSLMWMSYVTCRGNESDIQNCTHAGFDKKTYCSHAVGVAVVCGDGPVEEASDFEVRFLGNHTFSGRVEIFHSGEWNGLCMREIEPSVVAVICRSLGYSAGFVPGLNHRDSFGLGFSEVWAEKITCSGSESTVKDCQRVQWVKKACHSSQQLAVGCYNDTAAALSWRLSGGDDEHQGVVDVLLGNHWGRICPGAWYFATANYVCRRLGFKKAVSAIQDSRLKYNSKPLPILIDGLSCEGPDNCTYVQSSGHCPESESYTGVVCSDDEKELEMSVRLVGGRTGYEGNVQVLYNGEWGYICGTQWGLAEANVTCRMLGLKSASQAKVRGFPEDDKYLCRVWVDVVRCTGSEDSLLDCSLDQFASFSCEDPKKKAGVVCEFDNNIRIDPITAGEECNLEISAEYTDVRLISNGSDTTGSGKGRVEIYYKGTWGTICDDQWDVDDATVVCKSLGFSLASRVAKPGEFGQGTGHIWMNNMNCDGTENSLSQCYGTKYYLTNCVHEEDAGVVCAGQLQLKQGNNDNLKIEISLIVSGVLVILLIITLMIPAIYIRKRLLRKDQLLTSSDAKLETIAITLETSITTGVDSHYDNVEEVVIVNAAVQDTNGEETSSIKTENL